MTPDNNQPTAPLEAAVAALMKFIDTDEGTWPCGLLHVNPMEPDHEHDVTVADFLNALLVVEAALANDAPKLLGDRDEMFCFDDMKHERKTCGCYTSTIVEEDEKVRIIRIIRPDYYLKTKRKCSEATDDSEPCIAMLGESLRGLIVGCDLHSGTFEIVQPADATTEPVRCDKWGKIEQRGKIIYGECSSGLAGILTKLEPRRRKTLPSCAAITSGVSNIERAFIRSESR